MSHPKRRKTDRELLELEANLRHLRSLLDQRVPRVTTIPALAGAAEELFPSLGGLDAILAHW